MILSRLNDIKDAYKARLHSRKYDQIYKWRSLQTFQDNWDIGALDFKAMYERSFANTLANDLWEGQNYFPKRSMLAFIEQDPDLVRTMFKELYNENLEIEGRVERFLYHCDEMRDDMLRTNPRYQHHYHEGYRMISVYLCFKYPTEYCVYDYEMFKGFMEQVGAKPTPTSREIGRFFKVMRTVNKIVSKDLELTERHKELRGEYPDAYQADSLLMIEDMLRFRSV